ncbi:Cys-tRNA(Pro) deacylase [Paraglaciecola sp. L3A3]|uniref:Cys-tRNA(Pro) deacylase n=1 Tax=Paraglaciecola sp. L3A3 TaxID=2686358 RepID=UPI00131C6A97|nr:Cys-tRNA(Pro) deacylase [Paraglaciecola sp. L3A3]
MTPAINTLKKLKIKHQIHSYEHDENHASFGLEAAEKLNVAAQRVFKTLVVKLDSGALAVAVLPVDKMLSMKLIAKALSAKKAEMADKLEVQRSTGYVLGGVSPLGQKKRLKTVIDASAEQEQTIYVSAGKRGLEIELSSQDLALATQAKVVQIIS